MSQLPLAVVWPDDAIADLRALQQHDPRLAPAALQAADDVANHHAHGKALGARHVSGDLTGCYRLRFDLPGTRPQRYRLVYDRPDATTIRVVGVGERIDSTIYRQLAQRLGLG